MLRRSAFRRGKSALLYAVQLAYSSNWQRRESGARDISLPYLSCLSLAAAVSSFFDMQG
jgi:hypothetical protein